MCPIPTCIATHACVYLNMESEMTPQQNKGNAQPNLTKVYPRSRHQPPSSLDMLCLLDESVKFSCSGAAPRQDTIVEADACLNLEHPLHSTSSNVIFLLV